MKVKVINPDEWEKGIDGEDTNHISILELFSLSELEERRRKLEIIKQEIEDTDSEFRGLLLYNVDDMIKKTELAIQKKKGK